MVRRGLRPRLFLRTTEFLWQEGHTAHATEAEARRFALDILRDVYEDFMVDVLAIPVLTGRKTERERFSGATTTWTCEAMMRDGKALQMGTSHELGQNFARVFDTTFLDESGTSPLGVADLVGGVVPAHGGAGHGARRRRRVAQRPLSSPPSRSSVLVVRDEDGAADKGRHRRCASTDAGGCAPSSIAATDPSFGRRVVDWELKGVPVRVEVGPRAELERSQVVLVPARRRGPRPR